MPSLSPAEKAKVLEILIGRRFELREEAEQIAQELISVVDSPAIADDVESDLLALTVEDLSGRAGRQRHGYVHPADAAQELLEEAIEPYLTELRRLIKLGLKEQAVASAVGVIAGLYRCRDAAEGEFLLAWAPDFPWEMAHAIREELRIAGIVVALQRMDEVAPDWAE